MSETDTKQNCPVLLCCSICNDNSLLWGWFSYSFCLFRIQLKCTKFHLLSISLQIWQGLNPLFLTSAEIQRWLFFLVTRITTMAAPGLSTSWYYCLCRTVTSRLLWFPMCGVWNIFIYIFIPYWHNTESYYYPKFHTAVIVNMLKAPIQDTIMIKGDK